MDEAVDVIEEWNGLSEKDLLNGSEGLLLQVKDRASLLGEQALGSYQIGAVTFGSIVHGDGAEDDQR
ncbi:hypothetical protein F2Q70_00030986 [Brassica cretica]|nr:hypothetical protein F2Q70_00030986 [Brassica cretica]